MRHGACGDMCAVDRSRDGRTRQGFPPRARFGRLCVHPPCSTYTYVESHPKIAIKLRLLTGSVGMWAGGRAAPPSLYVTTTSIHVSSSIWLRIRRSLIRHVDRERKEEGPPLSLCWARIPRRPRRSCAGRGALPAA